MTMDDQIRANNLRFFGVHPPPAGCRTSPRYRIDGAGEPVELFRIVDLARATGESVTLFDELGACGTVDGNGEVRIW